MFLLLLIEVGRLPFDTEDRQLELSMQHKALDLEHAGPPLAFLQLAGLLRFGTLLAFTANIPQPLLVNDIDQASAGLVVLCFVWFAIKVAVLLVLIGVWEFMHCRVRLIASVKLLGIAMAALLLADGLIIAESQY
jgi:formate hydrogenlyase subunit 4